MANIVRRAQERDIPAVMELLKQVNRIHYEGRPDLFKPVKTARQGSLLMTQCLIRIRVL